MFQTKGIGTDNMFINEIAATNAAKKSSFVKDNGHFIVVYYPHQDGYGYYVSEAWAKHDGTWETFEVIARYSKPGWLRSWTRTDTTSADILLEANLKS